MLKYSRTRTQQPQGAVQIDWSNPITRGLLVAVVGNENLNRANGRVLPRVGVSYAAASRQGVGTNNLVNANSHVLSLQRHESIIGGSACSALTVYDVLVSGVSDIDGQILNGYASYFSTSLFGVEGYSNQTIAHTKIAFSGVPSTMYPGSFFSAGQSARCVVRAASGRTHDIFKNGNLIQSQAVAGGQTITDAGSQTKEIRTYVPGTKGSVVVHLKAHWNRFLSDAEVAKLSANPWQIFKPRSLILASVVTAQYARPTSDVSAGTWTASTGSDLFAMLDEAAADDADYISTTYASICEVALGSLSDPASSAGHKVRYRIAADAGAIIVRLRQGATTIASWTHNPAPASLTTFEQTLSGAEADSITDYAALKLQFEAF